MTIQSGQTVDLTFAKESTYGTRIGGDVYTRIPYNTVSLALTKSVVESNQLTGDRNVHDVFQGAHSVAGDITFNLSHQAVFTEMLEAVLGDHTASSGVIEVGTERSSYTIHEAFTDLATTKDNHAFVGCEFNTFAMTIPADGLIECTVGVIGATLETHDNRQDGTVSNFSDTNEPFHSSDVTITIDGGSTALTTITDFSLNIDNGIATTNRVGSNIPIQGGISKCRVTGSLTAHFESTTLFEKFIDENNFVDLTVLVGASGGAETGILFDMSKVRITAGNVEVGGEGLVSVALEYTALRNDSNDQSTIQIDTDLS